MVKTKYTLEVYEPGDNSTVAFVLNSESPFPAILVGHHLHWMKLRMGDWLEVTHVQHMFWEAGGTVTCKTGVETKLISG